MTFDQFLRLAQGSGGHCYLDAMTEKISDMLSGHHARSENYDLLHSFTPRI
jgi:hypothetical protein